MQTSECSPFKLTTMKAIYMLILGVLGASYNYRDQLQITPDWCTVGFVFRFFVRKFCLATSLPDVSKGNYSGTSAAKYGGVCDECTNTKVRLLMAN